MKIYYKVNMLKSQIKISKFRFSRMNNSFLGNKINMDPLILKRFKDTDIFNNLFGYDKSVDIWSLGTLCYEMLIGQWFFNERNKNDLLKKLKISKYTIPSHLSKEVIFFLKGMLQNNPTKRLTIEQLATHDFLNKKIENFQKIDLELLGKKIKNDEFKLNTKNKDIICDALNIDNKLISINSLLHLYPFEEDKNYKFRENENSNQKNINNNIKNNNFNNKEFNIKDNNLEIAMSNYLNINNNNNSFQQKNIQNNSNNNPKINLNLNNVQNNNIFNNNNNANILNHNIFPQQNNLIIANKIKPNLNNFNQNYQQLNNKNIINNKINNVNLNNAPNFQYNNYSQNTYIKPNNMNIPKNPLG